MSDDENTKPVNIDPRCIQEALRIYFQPIKNDDPKLDFYTMYKRETMEYDTQYMEKYNEDLNTTLIFAGLFSAVNSAFIVYVQPQLQPDSGDRSEAYLRAILLTLNPSISPHEDPSAPPTWNNPPTEIITTSGLLYASLLMSLLGAFVAMLGKQWLTRYLRHTGGSIIERCSDRQRKCDGLEKWPFHFFIGSLPVMLQIALLLLACGLSRYTWSVNTSVGRVVISFTVLGFLFYIGIVVAGTSSYECPFQTPASIALRHLGGSVLSPPKIISFISATRKRARILLALPSFTSLIYATWMDAREVGRNLGDEATILLFRIDGSVRDAVGRLTQEIRSIRHTGVLPITRDPNQQQLTPRSGPRLLVRVRNLEALRSQNTGDARCVSWILRNITDPEAIDSAIRLAGDIRWFNGGPTDSPPYSSIVSIFETCFDSTKQLYPGMRDRAYFSARALLQINTRAGAQPHDNASRYPVPIIPSRPYESTDPDLHNILYMLEQNFVEHKRTLHFPNADRKAHSLWMTNLFLDLSRIYPKRTLRAYKSYLTAATADHRASIANILLVWYMILGGQVEEETLWTVDKSDSLETILSHLSARVMSTIADGTCIHYLHLLLEFLAAWEKRPECLTRMVYQWCSTISEAVKVLRPGETRIGPSRLLRRYVRNNVRHRPQDPENRLATNPFFTVRSNRDSAGSDATHAQARHSLPQDLYEYILSILLEVGFRLARNDATWAHILPDDHHELIFETAFSSDDDEVVADALRMWITSGVCTSLGSFSRYFTKRLERDRPFPRELQRLIMCVIVQFWMGERPESGPEIVHLLNRLNANTGWSWSREQVDLGSYEKVDLGYGQMVLVRDVVRGPGGLALLPYYWRLLDRLVVVEGNPWYIKSGDWDIMRALREAEDWEKLEVWMLVTWKSLLRYATSDSEQSMEDIRKVTLELLLHRQSALRRFESLYGEGQGGEEGDPCEEEEESDDNPKRVLRDICKRTRIENPPSEGFQSPPQPAPTRPLVPTAFAGDDSF